MDYVSYKVFLINHTACICMLPNENWRDEYDQRKELLEPRQSTCSNIESTWIGIGAQKVLDCGIDSRNL